MLIAFVMDMLVLVVLLMCVAYVLLMCWFCVCVAYDDGLLMGCMMLCGVVCSRSGVCDSENHQFANTHGLPQKY